MKGKHKGSQLIGEKRQITEERQLADRHYGMQL
jgi:hypothetical protein